MIYMSSLLHRQRPDPDHRHLRRRHRTSIKAQVLVQNRVQTAEPRLPEDARRIGVTVNKNSPDILMVAFFTSPDNSLDEQPYRQLRHSAGAGPADPRRRAWATPIVARRARLLRHAHLGGPGPRRRPQSDGGRGGERRPRAERAGRRRRASASRPSARPGPPSSWACR